MSYLTHSQRFRIYNKAADPAASDGLFQRILHSEFLLLCLEFVLVQHDHKVSDEFTLVFAEILFKIKDKDFKWSDKM